MKKNIWLITILAVMCFATADAIIIGDFDTGDKPNNLGGDFGAWDKDPADDSQSCKEKFDEGNTRHGLGYCMRLEYDVDSPNAAFNGFWMKLEGLDGTPFSKMVFWAKGDAMSGFTSRMKLEMKTPSEHGAYYVDGISAAWTRFEVPLTEFFISDFSTVSEIVFVFEDHSCDPKEGVVFLDDIGFE